jgi:hypothetical protein
LKRFTDTDLWDKEWFMNLGWKHKLLIKFLFAKCDAAGVWSPNWVLASSYIGAKVGKEDLKPLSKQVEVLPDGRIFIVDFCHFQYGTLTERCAPHRKIITLLKKYNLFERVTKGYQKGIDTLQEEEEEKEEEKEKDKEEEKESATPETFTEDQKTKFSGFQEWITKNAPTVNRMEKPFTIEEYVKLKEKFSADQIASLVTKMGNYKPLVKNNSSAYLTFLNWAEREWEGTTQPITNGLSKEALALQEKLLRHGGKH